jgi:signal recognition particle subunit SEC65
LYQTCDRLPLSVFLDCLFDREYEGLIISGQPTQDELINRWQNLYQEYCEITNQGNLSDHMKLMQDCNVCLCKIQVVEAINKVFRWYYSPELVEILEQLGLKPGIKPDDDFPTIARKMEMVATRAKKLIVEYQTKKQQLDKLEAINKAGESTRAVYEDGLTALSRNYGYPVKASDISVARFVRETERLNKEIQRRQAELKQK